MRTSALEYEDIQAGKARLIERGERFGEISQKVAFTPFVLHGCQVCEAYCESSEVLEISSFVS